MVEIYQVGGAVRDKLLGLPVRDRDWVVIGSTAEEMTDRGFRQVGRDFPVFLHPQTHEEYALARTERKIGPGYRGFEVDATPDVSLEEDLRRRDLTINAMAQAPDGTLIDPWGGRDDLAKRLLRHVSPAFREDPLRILRVAHIAGRLARFEFHVAPETMALMRKMVSSGDLATLAIERVWSEFEQALAEGQPSRFIQVLRDCGALAKLLPEIEALFGRTVTNSENRQFDAGELALRAIDYAARQWQDSRIGFAALCHHIAGYGNNATTSPGDRELSERIAAITACCQRLHTPRSHSDLAILAASYCCTCLDVDHLAPDKILAILEATDAFRRPSRFELFLRTCAVLGLASNMTTAQFRQGAGWRAYLAAAKGVNIQSLLAQNLRGPLLGTELRRLRLNVIGAEKSSHCKP